MNTSRRRFLQKMFGATLGFAIADDVLEVLDQMAPRPVVVPGWRERRPSHLEDIDRVLREGLVVLRRHSIMPQLINRRYAAPSVDGSPIIVPFPARFGT